MPYTLPRDLVAWHAAAELSSLVSATARSLPAVAQSTLGTRLQRSAAVVAARLAEGLSAGSHEGALRLLYDALAALGEVELSLQVIAAERMRPAAELGRLAALVDDVRCRLRALEHRMTERCRRAS